MLCCLLWLCGAAYAQFSATGDFTRATLDPGWTTTGSAKLTKATGGSDSAVVTPGWLRLTENAGSDQGAARYNGGSFSAITGLTISFDFVSWGGNFPSGTPGADGISVFLYDANQNMSGAVLGGGLGYCKGAGAYLGIGLDEFGNFSNANDRCTFSGGPGAQAQRLVLLGPTSVPGSNPVTVNPFIANSSVTGNIDNANVNPGSIATRPAFNQVEVRLTPSSPVGFSVTVLFSNVPGNPPTAIPNLTNILFPYQAPTSLSVGIAASTGLYTNIHEIRSLLITGNAPPQPFVNKSFNPPTITTGSTSTLLITLSAANSTPRTSATLTTAFVDTLPSGVVIATPNALNTNCPNPVTATAGSSVVSYPTGGVIPANGCSISVNVASSVLGPKLNTIPAGGLVTAQGSNAVPATATLTVVAIAPPSLSKVFTPVAMAPGATAVLQIRLNNPNTVATSLSATLTDTLPAGMTIANPPALATSGCALASLAANAGGNTVTYATGATLPAGGCTLSVNVTANPGNTTTYTNTLAVGALQTGVGSNAVGATATLAVNGGAFLLITKNNFTESVLAGSTTTYTIVATNNGPAAANNAVVRDIPSPGVNCLGGILNCTPSNGAACPASLNLQNFVQGGTPGTGLTIPTFPSGGVVTFTLSCGVRATGL